VPVLILSIFICTHIRCFYVRRTMMRWRYLPPNGIVLPFAPPIPLFCGMVRAIHCSFLLNAGALVLLLIAVLTAFRYVLTYKRLNVVRDTRRFVSRWCLHGYTAFALRAALALRVERCYVVRWRAVYSSYGNRVYTVPGAYVFAFLPTTTACSGTNSCLFIYCAFFCCVTSRVRFYRYDRLSMNVSVI